MGGFGSGPRPKSVDMHIAEGTYRADRHGKATLTMHGEPTKPRGMSKDESWMWDQIVKAYRGTRVLAEIDVAIVRSACEMWSLYRAALETAKAAPCDQDARLSVTGYWAKWETAARRLGLNPVDRARLKPAATEKPKVASRAR